MTAVAPAAWACRASATECSVRYAATQTITGALPPTAASTASLSCWRSGTSMAMNSPALPATHSPCAPLASSPVA